MPDTARRPFLLLVLFALLGAADGLYLSFVHINYEIGYGELPQVCHQLSPTGCTVTAGRFGDIYGIPVATFGFAGCLAVAVLATIARRRRDRYEDPYRSTIVSLAFAAVAASITMAVLSFVEGAYCPFCVLWYGINLGLAWAAWQCRDRGLGIRDTLDDSIGTPALVAALVFGGTLYGTTALMRAHKAELQAELDHVLIPKFAADMLAEPVQNVEIADAASKGPTDADVTFVEFGDFECPHCRRLYYVIEHYAQTTSHSVRVVFANFPLDSACNPHVDRKHPHACIAAFAGECARQQDQFWPYADLLFEHQNALERYDVLAYADQLGLDRAAFTACIDAPATRSKVRADVEIGMALGITGTPTFFTNGHKWTGAMAPSTFAGVVDKVLSQEAAQQ